MLLPFLILTALAAPQTAQASTPSEHAQTQAQTWHVPGTPPPAPRRDQDTPPVIKDKPLPPV